MKIIKNLFVANILLKSLLILAMDDERMQELKNNFFAFGNVLSVREKLNGQDTKSANNIINYLEELYKEYNAKNLSNQPLTQIHEKAVNNLMDLETAGIEVTKNFTGKGKIATDNPTSKSCYCKKCKLGFSGIQIDNHYKWHKMKRKEIIKNRCDYCKTGYKDRNAYRNHIKTSSHLIMEDNFKNNRGKN